MPALAQELHVATGQALGARVTLRLSHPDAAAIAARVVRLATDGVLEAVDGSPVRIPAESICVHGDTPGAVAIARAVRVALQAAGVELAPFA